jgi:hypothetical protein
VLLALLCRARGGGLALSSSAAVCHRTLGVELDNPENVSFDIREQTLVSAFAYGIHEQTLVRHFASVYGKPRAATIDARDEANAQYRRRNADNHPGDANHMVGSHRQHNDHARGRQTPT